VGVKSLEREEEKGRGEKKEREKERGEEREEERREEEEEEEERLVGRLKWGFTRIGELKQLYSEVLKEGVKGLSAKLETSNLLLTAEVYLPENAGRVSFNVCYTEDGYRLVSYVIDLKDLLITYNGASGVVVIKDNYETWVGIDSEEPSSVSIDEKNFMKHLLTTLAYHAFSNSDIPLHIANEHIWRLAELEKKLFPLSD